MDSIATKAVKHPAVRGMEVALVCWASMEMLLLLFNHTVSQLPGHGESTGRGAAGNPRFPRLLPGTLGNFPGCL